MTTTAPRGALVIQPLPGIGDMVWHLPHLHALARSRGEGLTLLTKPRSGADKLLAGDASVKKILWLERAPGKHGGLLGFLRLVAMLRRERFAEVWVLHGSSRYAAAAFLAGIPKRIGYGQGMQRWWLNHPVFLNDAEQHRHPIDKATLLLQRCGLSLPEAEPCLPVSATVLQSVLQGFAALPRPWIALAIGTSEPSRQWGEANFTELARRLHRHWQQPTLFLVGGPAEHDLATRIQNPLTDQGVRIESVTHLPLDQTAALLSQCRCCIGNETGALNLAAAVAIDTFGLFGGPPLTHSRFIHAVTPNDPGGMRAITVDAVMAVLMRRWPQSTPTREDV